MHRKKSIGGNWIKDNRAQLRDIIKKGKIVPFHEFMQNKEAWLMDEWRYLQLGHFVSSLPQPIRSGEDLSELERLCLVDSTKGILSKIYKLLLSGEGTEVPPFIRKWERELGSQKDNTIRKILELNHSSAVDINTAEMNYKCLVGM